MINKRQTLCPNRRQRRRTIERAQLVLAQAEDLLLVALFFIVFLYPLLLDPTLLFNLPTWLWWVKGFAWIGLLAWAVIRLLVGLPLAPAQITGATVEAMEQAAPEKELVSFTAEPVEIECTLLPLAADTVVNRTRSQYAGTMVLAAAMATAVPQAAL
ncbi:MAG: hypothetical protein M5U34_45260 [Chloroflexi bacterium]|nr:hypothetical protein [Chloroflexota bacterium]